MTQLALLADDNTEFPSIHQALEEPNGLLAAGGDLSPARLVKAYQSGIFPWYDDDQPILWWSPDPRCVIQPERFRASRSLQKKIRGATFDIRIDTDFRSVISHCRFRGGSEGTWITEDMKAAYIALHDLGIAHSVECYIEDELAGGLYGVSIGQLFFGESMFHRVTDASKLAFAGLMQAMQSVGCPLVDCQVTNPHLLSLGATEITRQDFAQFLKVNADSGRSIDWDELHGSLVLLPHADVG